MKFKNLLSLALAGLLAAAPAYAAEPQDTAVTAIILSDSQVTVDGASASRDPGAAVYVGADIVYYHDNTDETYGEGGASDKHTAQEAAAHTVVTITQSGAYRLTGSLSQGQIAVDLGQGAKDDPQAVVTLILDNASVTCAVAPALIFYNVYECDRAWARYDSDENPDYKASAQVDTSAAGANVILAAGSVNTFQGSHVARIYKEGTTKKLHKYDGAFYSKMSMNINGDNGDDSGLLNIVADHEGLDSEVHLTLNGGTIHITAYNDGINTNEDNVSVTTINGGSLTVNAGTGVEGDGIDSNGYLVINGGTVWTMSNDRSADGGIDSDCGILLNGGTVSAFGVRNDSADAASGQPYMELSFARALPVGSALKLTDQAGNLLWTATTQKSCQSVTLTNSALTLNTPYRLYVDDVLQCWNGNRFGMGRPNGMDGGRREDMPQPPEGFDPGKAGERPTDMPQPPEGFEPGQRPQRPEGSQFRPEDGGTPPEGAFGRGDRFPFDGQGDGSGSTDFTLTAQTKSFSGICDADPATSPFTDVSQEDPGYEAVKTLHQSGVIQGDGQGHFFPDAVIAPEHWQLMLERLTARGADVSALSGADGLTRREAAIQAAKALQ